MTELGPRSDFIIIDVPESKHFDLLCISGNSDIEEERRRLWSAAIATSFVKLKKEKFVDLSSDINDYLDSMDLEDIDVNIDRGSDVDHVVIVMHGIRDNGFWTKRVASEVMSIGRYDNMTVWAPTLSCGYFSMWNFIVPFGRERALLWFMERYADVKTHFPNPRISFVGHSNGTYLAARSLVICDAILFENIALARSVI